MPLTLIRPHYHRDAFAGFVIWVYNHHVHDYEPVGKPFELYKHAALALTLARPLIQEEVVS